MENEEIARLRRSDRIGAISLLVLNIFDIVTTYWALSLGAVEGNPVSDFLLKTNLLIPSKIFIIGLITWACFHSKQPTIRSNSVLWWVVGVYSLTIVLNMIHLITLL